AHVESPCGSRDARRNVVAPPRRWVTALGHPTRASPDRSCDATSAGDPSPALEDDRLAVEPEHLAIDVGDLAQARVVLHGVDQHRHDVAAVATGVAQLLEPALDLAHVAGRLEAADPLDLLELDPLVDAQVIDRLLFRHHVLVHADRDLLAAILHELVAVGGVGDLLLRIARIDRPHDPAHGVDPLDVLAGARLDLVAQLLQAVGAAQRVD